jgi:hypothetical protein
MSTKTILTGSCLLLALVVALGCPKSGPRMESGRGAAKGTITLDGQPVRGGTIFLVSAKDSRYQVAVTIKSDGTSSVADSPTGEVLVAIDNESQKFNNPQAYVPIPAKYKDIKTSGLKLTVGADQGEGGLKIELKSK